MKKLAILLVICAQIGCTNNQNKSHNGENLPVKHLMILDQKEGGWGADFRISIVNVIENDSVKIYKAISKYDDENLGLLISIPKKKTGNNSFGDRITIRSIGIESDNLLHELAKCYKITVPSNSKFAKIVLAGFVDLGAFAQGLHGKRVDDDPDMGEYKLYFAPKDEEAELLLNINLTDDWLELSEKDPEYRALIISAFTQ